MDLLTGNVKKLFSHLLVASLGSALVSSIFGIVDAMMVGQYQGPNGVAALAVFSPIWNIVYSLGILSGIGGSVLYANRRGAGKKERANAYFTTSVIFGVVLTILAVIGITVFQEPLFRFFGADDTLLELAKTYLKPIRFAIPCCVFSNILSAYLRNDGDAPLAMKAVLFGGVFNMVGDYMLIFTFDLGIFGAGLATTIGQYGAILMMLTHFLKKSNTLRFVRPERIGHRILNISKSGFATAISDVSMGIVTVLFNRSIMKYLGSDALAVYGIIAQIVPLVQCCAYGVGQAAQPIISQNLGAKQYDRIRECMRYGIFCSVIFGVIWVVLVCGFPNVFVRLFMTPTEEVLAIAPAIMRTYGLAFLLIPFNIFSTYYFQAILKPAVSMVISLGRGVVLVSGIILLLPVLFGANAIWFAVPLTELIIGGFAVIEVRRSRRTLRA